MPKKKILLIEDENMISEMYTYVFEQRGYSVSVALDGVAGVEVFKQGQPFDLVLLDVMLPKKNGIDVLREIKEHKPQVPVFLLTNLGQESVLETAAKLGAEGSIVKSNVLPEQVIELVDTFFTRTTEQSTAEHDA